MGVIEQREADKFMMELVETIYCRIFNHNKHTANVDIDFELREALLRLQDKLADMALENSLIR